MLCCVGRLQELHSELKKVQAELSKYTHVNKKALDQFANFTEQMDELGRRREEVNLSCAWPEGCWGFQ